MNNMKEIIDSFKKIIDNKYAVEYLILNPTTLKIIIKINQSIYEYIVHSYRKSDNGCVFHECSKDSRIIFDEMFNCSIFENINNELIQAAHDLSFLNTYFFGKNITLDDINNIDKITNETKLRLDSSFKNIHTILYYISKDIFFGRDRLKISTSVIFDPNIDGFKYEIIYREEYERFKSLQDLKFYLFEKYAIKSLDKKIEDIHLNDNKFLPLCNI